jgi:GTP-binding protein HflX
MERNRNGRASQTGGSNGAAGLINRRAAQRALAVGVLDADPGDRDPLAELKELLRTAGVATAGELVQRRDSPDPDRYLGRGKIAELNRRCDANVVAVDDELAPRL